MTTTESHAAAQDTRRILQAITKAEVRSSGSSNQGNSIELRFRPDQKDDYLFLHGVGHDLGAILAGIRPAAIRDCIHLLKREENRIDDGEHLYRILQDLDSLATDPDGQHVKAESFRVTAVGKATLSRAFGSGSIQFHTDQGDIVLEMDADEGNALAELASFIQKGAGDNEPVQPGSANQSGFASGISSAGNLWVSDDAAVIFHFLVAWAWVPALALGLLVGSIFL